MRIYTKEIPGTKNLHNEDSHFATTFEYNAKEFCLAIVADGCSGYSGSKASHTAVHDLGHTIREKISLGEQNYEALIRSSVEVVNGELHKMSATRTTLDLLLLTDNYGCIAHAGDSRIYAHTSQRLMKVTEDDLANGEPSNYLGAYYIGNNSLQDRLSVRVFSEEELDSINGFFLATDGLWSRVPEKYFFSLFDNAENITALFDMIDREVYLPRLKIKELSEARIKAEFGAIFTSLGLSVTGSAAELSEQLYSLYVERNEDVVKRLDKKVIPFDDTTLIYVDRHNVIDSLLQERYTLKTVGVPDLERTVQKLNSDLAATLSDLLKKEAEVKAMCTQLSGQSASAQASYMALQNQYDDLTGNYNLVCTVRDGLQADKDTLVGEKRELVNQIGVEEQKRTGFMGRLETMLGKPFLDNVIGKPIKKK